MTAGGAARAGAAARNRLTGENSRSEVFFAPVFPGISRARSFLVRAAEPPRAAPHGLMKARVKRTNAGGCDGLDDDEYDGDSDGGAGGGGGSGAVGGGGRAAASLRA